MNTDEFGLSEEQILMRRNVAALLARVLPVMLGVMMDHPARFEGKPFYPVVRD